jgi:hypothetical protein
MGRLLAIVMLGSMTVAQLSLAEANSGQNSDQQSTSGSENTTDNVRPLPPPPTGKSTVIGGVIQGVDPVRDQFTLKVAGGKPTKMKILFDARTQVYRDGKKIAVRDLRPDDHASVETVLDGTTVFAISVRMLSKAPEGESQGQVLDYNPGTRQLTISDALSHQAITLIVPEGTPIARRGQAASDAIGIGTSDLVKGALLSLKFQSDKDGHAVADQISILATPGSNFTFDGNVTVLDLHAKTLTLLDPSDGESYKIAIDPGRLPIAKDLREGSHVGVNATFDGTQYVATAITVK